MRAAPQGRASAEQVFEGNLRLRAVPLGAASAEQTESLRPRLSEAKTGGQRRYIQFTKSPIRLKVVRQGVEKTAIFTQFNHFFASKKRLLSQ